QRRPFVRRALLDALPAQARGEMQLRRQVRDVLGIKGAAILARVLPVVAERAERDVVDRSAVQVDAHDGFAAERPRAVIPAQARREGSRIALAVYVDPSAECG